jgi:3-oxoadipate enol-lactonase
MMHIRLQDFNIDYDDRGFGVPLLLIHGYPLTRAMWEPQVIGLNHVARVIAPSLRGHGSSDPVRGPYSMEMLADDCLDLLDNIGVKVPAVIAGLSMGGYITLALLRKYPQRVAGIILAATRAGADSPEGQANRDKSAALAQERGSGAIVETMLPKMLSPKSYQDKPELVTVVRQMMENTSIEGITGDLMGMKTRIDSTATLSQINKPTLILHGADDQLIPSKEAEVMHAAIPGSRLQIVLNAGHLLNMEQPNLFNQAVRDFLLSI